MYEIASSRLRILMLVINFFAQFCPLLIFVHTFVLYRFLFTLLSAIDFCAHFCPLQIFFHTFVCYRLRILNPPPPLFLGSPVLLMYKYDTSKIFYFTNFLLHLAHYVSTAFFMIYRIVYLDSSTWEWNLEVYIYI